jgi:hypothetical protein
MKQQMFFSQQQISISSSISQISAKRIGPSLRVKMTKAPFLQKMPRHVLRETTELSNQACIH